MIRITIGEKKYDVPNTFDDVTIGLYQKLSRIEDGDEIEMLLDYMEVLTGLDRETIKMIELEDIRKITKNLLTLFNKGEYDVIDAVKIGGDIYVFDHNLDNMKFNMFIDLEELTKDKENINNYLHLVAAILYRPIKRHKKFLYIPFRKRKIKPEIYDSTSVKERADYFQENMMMDKILGSLFFFINLRVEYTKIMMDYLEQQVKEKENE